MARRVKADRQPLFFSSLSLCALLFCSPMRIFSSLFDECEALFSFLLHEYKPSDSNLEGQQGKEERKKGSQGRRRPRLSEEFTLPPSEAVRPLPHQKNEHPEEQGESSPFFPSFFPSFLPSLLERIRLLACLLAGAFVALSSSHHPDQDGR